MVEPGPIVEEAKLHEQAMELAPEGEMDLAQAEQKIERDVDIWRQNHALIDEGVLEADNEFKNEQKYEIDQAPFQAEAASDNDGLGAELQLEAVNELGQL